MSIGRVKVWVQRRGDREHLVLEWHDPDTGQRRSKSAGTANEGQAEQLRAALEDHLSANQRICPVCTASFVPRNGRTYCSPGCSRLAMNRKALAWRGGASAPPPPAPEALSEAFLDGFLAGYAAGWSLKTRPPRADILELFAGGPFKERGEALRLD